MIFTGRRAFLFYTNQFKLSNNMEEKIYCFDRPCYGSDNAALVAALTNNNRGIETAALMNGGFGGANAMWNNPMMYLVWLAVLGNGGFGFGGNRGGSIELNGRFDAIQSQIDTNHNNDIAMQAIQGNHNAIHELAGILNTSFANVSSGICDVRSAIKEVGGQVGFSAERVINAANVGDMNIITAIKDCCCQTQQNIIKMGYENQINNLNQTNTIQSGFDRTNTGLERGFSSVAYETQRQTCDIINSGKDNTQRIIDTLNDHWKADLMQRYNDARLELSQQRQNAYLVEQLKPAA